MKIFQKLVLLPVIMLFIYSFRTSFDPSVVKTSTFQLNGDTLNVIKLNQKGNRLRVKYFAYRQNNRTVEQRYKIWSRSKDVITVSSGTYMNSCRVAEARPVGLCLDEGNLVEQRVRKDLGAVILMYASGKVDVHRTTDVRIKDEDGSELSFDLTNAMQFSEFRQLARQQGMTVVQSHLLYFNNKIDIGDNSSNKERERRLWINGENEDGQSVYYIINLKGKNTLLSAAKKVAKYLTENEYIDKIKFMVNLDTGCQDIFMVNNPDGTRNLGSGFSGRENVTNSSNLVVYYYE